MKSFGVFMVGLLAAVGGIAAATYITKKKLEKENEEDYYNDWDDLDDDIDFDFDDDTDFEVDSDIDITSAPAAEAKPDELIEDVPADEADEAL